MTTEVNIVYPSTEKRVTALAFFDSGSHAGIICVFDPSIIIDNDLFWDFITRKSNSFICDFQLINGMNDKDANKTITD
uniref:Uncharacterized protein n=1 Tax=Heterorhabditis bacteriophora TaxID=37862 RepID=A0A1I7WLN5_HETBA